MVKFGYPHGWTWHGFYDCQNCLFPLYTVLNLDFRRGQKFNVPMRKMGLSRSSNRFFSSSQIRFVYIIKKPPIPLFPMVKMGMKLGYTLWKRFHNSGKSPFSSWLNQRSQWPWLRVRKL